MMTLIKSVLENTTIHQNHLKITPCFWLDALDILNCLIFQKAIIRFGPKGFELQVMLTGARKR
jgi:hypothetical protein